MSNDAETAAAAAAVADDTTDPASARANPLRNVSTSLRQRFRELYVGFSESSSAAA